MPTPEEERIIAQFRSEMWNAYTEPRNSRHHYHATWYRHMLEMYQPEGAAIHLIDKDDIPYGLVELAIIGMLHCSCEAIILRPIYRIPDLPSTPERREKGRRKLQDHFKYRAPWDDGQ